MILTFVKGPWEPCSNGHVLMHDITISLYLHALNKGDQKIFFEINDDNWHVHHAHVLECQTFVAKVMRFKDGLVQWVGFNRKKNGTGVDGLVWSMENNIRRDCQNFVITNGKKREQ